MCAKYYKNPMMLSRVTGKNVRDVFFWDNEVFHLRLLMLVVLC